MKSERAELEEALAYYASQPQMWNSYSLSVQAAANAHLATLPPDPVKAPDLYVVIGRDGGRWSGKAHDGRVYAEDDLRRAAERNPGRVYRIVRYVPQEE